MTQLIFAVEYEITKGRNTILVTNEKKILELFRKHKLGDNAIKLETYNKKYLS
jgi:hypothetical protein